MHQKLNRINIGVCLQNTILGSFLLYEEGQMQILKACKMKEYKKYFIIPAQPEEVYIALTNAATIQLWTGAKAEMSTEPGSEFSLWDENIAGRNIEFEEGKKIVQEWYFGEQEEESIVTIKLHPHKKGTSIELKHTNIPESEFNDIVEGWNEMYFGSLLEFYQE